MASILLILFFLTDPISYLPSAVLGAVIVAAAIGLVDPSVWRALWATDRVEVTIAAVTTGGVVAVGVLEALVFAVGLSIVDVVRRSARPHDAVLGWVDRLGRYGDVAVHPSARITPGVVVYRLDDRLFFANAGYVKGRVLEAVRGAPTEVRYLVFDAEAVTHVDATGLAALDDLRETLARERIELVVARAKTPLSGGSPRPASPGDALLSDRPRRRRGLGHERDLMGGALFWGLFAGSSLIVGGALALLLPIRERVARLDHGVRRGRPDRRRRLRARRGGVRDRSGRAAVWRSASRPAR